MKDLDKALLDIATIREKLTSGTEFQGFGPLTVALTGVLALVAGILQTYVPRLAETTQAFFTTWIITAIIAVFLMGIEMKKRSQRHHGGLADDMLRTASENFIPAGVVGALLLFVFSFFAPDLLWLLPSFWLILVGIGIFSALRFLPPLIMIGAAFYILLGLMTFINMSFQRVLTPWSMALPFALGQGLLSILLHRASNNKHDKKGSNNNEK